MMEEDKNETVDEEMDQCRTVVGNKKTIDGCDGSVGEWERA